MDLFQLLHVIQQVQSKDTFQQQQHQMQAQLQAQQAQQQQGAVQKRWEREVVTGVELEMIR